MAKRIKIKGKAPSGPSKLSGLSKRARVIGHHWEQSVGDNSPMETWPTKVLRAIAKVPKGASTAPSSTRKKLVKEGNPRFIGPRTLESEVAEDAATKFRESFGPSRAGEPTPAYVMRNVGKKGNLPRISKPKKQKTASGADSRIKALIALKRLSESGQLPGEVGRMLRDIPGI